MPEVTPFLWFDDRLEEAVTFYWDRLREGGSPGNIVDWVNRNDAFDAITAMLTVSATLRAGAHNEMAFVR